jgi:orotate phosphoribosyltransferase-like protein
VSYSDDTTHLMVAALADFTMNSDSGNVKLHLDIAISGVNRPVAALSAA